MVLRGLRLETGSWKTYWISRPKAAGSARSSALPSISIRPGRGRQEPHQHPRERGLAATGFADDPQRLALPATSSVVGRTAWTSAFGGPKKRLAHGKGLGEVFRLQRQRHAATSGFRQRTFRAVARKRDLARRQAASALAQRGAKAQPAGSAVDGRRQARDRLQTPPPAAKFRHAGDQPLGIGMGRRGKDRPPSRPPRRSGRHTSPPPGRRAGRRRRNRG